MPTPPTLLALLVLTLFAAACASTRGVPPAGEQTVARLGADVSPPWSPDYLLYLPEDYHADERRTWPLVLFLHGAGERGDSLDLVAVHGPPMQARRGDDFPFILVSPQAPEDRRWTDGLDYLDALLTEVADRYRVDPDRVYVTGLSMGGFGTWALAAAFPDRFAALAPVCGGGDPETACRFAEVPLWAFHGVQDTVVPVERTTEMIEALEACGAVPRVTLYPDRGHDAWTPTYDDPAFYAWLLAQHRDR